MTTNTRSSNTLVSLWLPIAIVVLGLIFFIFIVIEYQRNTALVEQNGALIASSAKAGLINSILSRGTSENWASIKGAYNWIKNEPHTYWFKNGVQEFPWHKTPTVTSNTAASKWQQVWSEINSPSAENSINRQRLTLLNSVKTALISNDQSLIQQSFDAYLEHKNAYYLSPPEEVAFSLRLVEIGAQKHWSRELVHAILITGGSSEAPLFRPVVDILFRHAELFTFEDFDFISYKIKQQLESFNLSDYFLDDYLRHLNKPRYILPSNLRTINNDLNIVSHDGWLLQQVSETLISAEPFVLTEELEFIESDFIDLNVLDEGDSIELNTFIGSIPIDALSIDVNKAQLNSDKRNQTAYLVFKSIMLTAFIALILLTLRLIEKNQQRRTEYLALREDFVKLVSHELKTPLAGIRAMAETLRKRVGRGLSVQSYPERIVSEADKLWYMVDNILSFNRVQSHEAVIERRPTKLTLICNNIVNDVQPFSSKPYQVSNKINESTEVLVDPELFSLVIKNIIVNAGLYNDHASIEINLSFDESAQCLLISDNGVGISDKDRKNIFKPFVRLKQSVRQSGTGLGLAICKRIMQLHNGDLSLAQSGSHGSVWKISLGLPPN